MVAGPVLIFAWLLSIARKRAQTLADAGAADVAVVGQTKTWSMVGAGITSGDRAKWVVPSASTCSNSTSDAEGGAGHCNAQ